jgi:hypothetical protein
VSIEELIFALEQAQKNAGAFVMVTVDNETHTVVHATGPFDQAEAALVQAGRDDAAWQEFMDGEEVVGDFSYLVVPLWTPS